MGNESISGNNRDTLIDFSKDMEKDLLTRKGECRNLSKEQRTLQEVKILYQLYVQKITSIRAQTEKHRNLRSR